MRTFIALAAQFVTIYAASTVKPADLQRVDMARTDKDLICGDRVPAVTAAKSIFSSLSSVSTAKKNLKAIFLPVSAVLAKPATLCMLPTLPLFNSFDITLKTFAEQLSSSEHRDTLLNNLEHVDALDDKRFLIRVITFVNITYPCVIKDLVISEPRSEKVLLDLYFVMQETYRQQILQKDIYCERCNVLIVREPDAELFAQITQDDKLLTATSTDSDMLTYLSGNNLSPTTETIATTVDDKTDQLLCEIRYDANRPTTLENDNRIYTNISKTSVLFVSVSFIILMVISLAWLVFYYVQRFRYAHAKDRLARRLFNAAKKALARIPTRALRQDDKELTADCPVCIEPYASGDIVRELPCRHIFHKSCVDPWLLEHRTCPMCKGDILKAFGYHFGRIDDGDQRAGTADGDRTSLDGHSTEGSQGSANESYTAYPFPLGTDSDAHDPFSFTPTGSPQLVQQVLHTSSAQGFSIIPLTVHSVVLPPSPSGAQPGTSTQAQRPSASTGNLTEGKSATAKDRSKGSPSKKRVSKGGLPNFASSYHSVELHRPPLKSTSSSSSSYNGVGNLGSCESSSSGEEGTVKPPGVIAHYHVNKARHQKAHYMAADHRQSHGSLPVAKRPKTLDPIPGRQQKPLVYDTGVSLEAGPNSQFLKSPIKTSVSLLRSARSRSLTSTSQDFNAAGKGAKANSDDKGFVNEMESAPSNPSTSNSQQSSAGQSRPATSTTFRGKTARTKRAVTVDSIRDTAQRTSDRSKKYHKKGTPESVPNDSL